MLSAALLVGCSGFLTPGEERRQKLLLEATETYRKLIRWGYYEEAAQYLLGKGEELPRPDLKQMAQYKVSAYNASEQLVNDEGDEIRQIVLIDYYDIDSGVLKHLRDEQYWWYDEEKRRWYLGSPMAALGADD
jgi:hypothetical protein